jgi:hypothetical protein
VLTAAAHSSFSHAECAIAAYLEDEGPGEDEGEDPEAPEDTDMNRHHTALPPSFFRR